MIIIKKEWFEIGPVTIIDYSDCEKLWSIFWDILPNFIYAEVIDICRDFWYITWFRVSQEAWINLSLEDLNKMIAPAKTLETPRDLETVLDVLGWFFRKTASLNLDFQKLSPDIAPFWLFRFYSIYEINIQYLKYTLEDFLDYLFLNLFEQKKIFWNNLIDELINNSWLLIDNIENKDTLKFSEKTYIESNKKIEYKWIQYPLHVRMIPGFWPWIEFVVSVVAYNHTHDNIGLNIAIQFERYQEKTCPVIHVIQKPHLNLWLDDNKIMSWQKEGVDNNIHRKNILNEDMLLELCHWVILFLLWKYDEIYFIAKSEMLWVFLHNNNNPQIIEKIVNRYANAYSYLTWIQTDMTQRGIINAQILTQHQSNSAGLGVWLNKEYTHIFSEIAERLSE